LPGCTSAPYCLWWVAVVGLTNFRRTRLTRDRTLPSYRGVPLKSWRHNFALWAWYGAGPRRPSCNRPALPIVDADALSEIRE